MLPVCHSRRENKTVRLAVVVTFALSALAAAPGKLVIVHPAVHQIEDGPDLSPEQRFLPGETVYFDFQIAGFSKVEDRPTDTQRVSLTWTVDVKDAAGRDLVTRKSGKITDDLRQEDKDWKPKARAEILIPPHAPAGSYTVHMTATDAVAGGSSTAGDYTFRVAGHPAVSAESLTIAGLGFYRSDEDSKPIQPAAYRPGDTFWNRFEIDGFKRGEGNRYDVSYGATVLRANGQTLFHQEEGATDKGESFYPKQWLGAGFSLALEKNLAPGPYALIIKARDRIGNQETEARQNFTVEP
jgi:hypothetical protein